MTAPLPALEECRPEVRAFARLMEHELRERDATRGPAGWKGARPFSLAHLLLTKTHATNEAVFACPATRLRLGDAHPDVAADIRAVVGMCADTANYAMMLADVLGGLAPLEPGP